MGGPQRFCNQCGQELRPGAQFCTKCGHSVAAGTPAGTPPIAPAGEDSGGGLGPAPATIIPAGSARGAADAPWPGTDQPRPGTDHPWPGTEPARPRAEQAGATFPGPGSGGYAPLPESGDQPPPASRRGRFLVLVIGLAAVAVAGAVLAVVLILRPSGQHSPARAGPAPTPTTTAPPAPSPSPSPSPSVQQQAAQGLAALLAKSVTDRAAVNAAFSDVQRCGGSLRRDVSTFRNAASSRSRLLSQLAALPSRSALPQQMLRKLTGAWQASIQADQDFAGWARDRLSGRCTGNGQSDPFYRAANGPDLRATADKTAFARRWDSLAAKYGLTEYRPGQL
jgi:zinc-ribbon domain